MAESVLRKIVPSESTANAPIKFEPNPGKAREETRTFRAAAGKDGFVKLRNISRALHLLERALLVLRTTFDTISWALLLLGSSAGIQRSRLSSGCCLCWNEAGKIALPLCWHLVDKATTLTIPNRNTGVVKLKVQALVKYFRHFSYRSFVD